MAQAQQLNYDAENSPHRPPALSPVASRVGPESNGARPHEAATCWCLPAVVEVAGHHVNCRHFQR